MSDVRRAARDQLGAIARQRAERADVGIGTKRPVEQAARVQLLEPVGIVPIGLPPGNRLAMAGIDQLRDNARRFKQVRDRDPKDTGRFHCHRVDATCQQPGNQGVQIGRKGQKHANRLRVAIGGHSNDHCFTPDIESGCIGMDTGARIEGGLPMGGAAGIVYRHEGMRNQRASLVTAKSSFISGVVRRAADATSHDIVHDQEPGCAVGSSAPVRVQVVALA